MMVLAKISRKQIGARKPLVKKKMIGKVKIFFLAPNSPDWAEL